ncbi:hypothetical protein [Agromyces mariniharenae]|uniref:Uncharacterized protein n=1 Tax=Agromyces mariniharenae TaxID=2604423 RepID=A0A5S4UZP2_9MICO|nr:hypothetical protein [Agromyces mariniharenae]TYL51189.1 hypothetical protein FYC51_18920 [Agromyces mariniharenae]
MPDATPRRLALNIPLIVLWVASIAVGAIGYWQLRAGNAGQADFYNTGGSDYLTYLDLQTQSTIGGMLLIAGIVGVLVALAVHARNRHASVVAREALAAAAPVALVEVDEFDEYDDADDTDAAADLPARDGAAAATVPAAASAETTSDEAAEAAEASAAVTATETPGTDTEPAAAETDESAASGTDHPKA